jgi:hypothetical protein
VVLIEVTPREGGDPAGDVRSLCRAGHRVLAISRSADPAQLAAIIGTGACLLLGSEQTATAVIAAIRAAGPARAAAVRDRLPGASRPDTSAATPAASSVSPHPGDVAGQAGPRRGAARAYLDRVRERYRETRRAAYTKLDTQQQADGTQASAPGT